MSFVWIACQIVRRLLSKRRNIVIFFLIPALVVSYAISVLEAFESSAPAVGLLDREGGAFGSAVTDRLEQQFHVIPVKDEAALEGLFVDGLANSAVIVSEDRHIRFVEWRSSPDAYAVKLTVGQIAAHGETYPEHMNNGSVAVNRSYSNAGTAVPAGMGIFLLFILSLSNSAVGTVLEDRSGKTLSRIYTAPVRPIEIAAGLFAGMLAVGAAQIVSILLSCRYLFGISFGESFSAQVLLLFCFLFAAVGLSTAIAGIARDRQHAGILNALLVTPTCMLGGCFWPVDIMPDIMQRLSNIVPQKWAMEGFYRLAGGGTVHDIAWHVGILILFAAVMTGLGSAALRPEQENARG